MKYDELIQLVKNIEIAEKEGRNTYNEAKILKNKLIELFPFQKAEYYKEKRETCEGVYCATCECHVKCYKTHEKTRKHATRAKEFENDNIIKARWKKHFDSIDENNIEPFVYEYST